MSDSFNLLAPPGFRGLHPDLPIRVYNRHLPHWRQAGATYSVTFRLADSIPQTHLRSLKEWRKNWERRNPKPRSELDWQQYAKEITHRTEAWLDQGYGACVFSNKKLAKEMENALVRQQSQESWTATAKVVSMDSPSVGKVRLGVSI